MQRYTSAPSFWGVYRREAVDQLSTIRYRAGFDHAVLARVWHCTAKIRPMSRDCCTGGEAASMPGIADCVVGATEQGNRGVPLDVYPG